MLKPPPPELSPADVTHSFGRLQSEQAERCLRTGGVQLEQVLSHPSSRQLELQGQVQDPERYPGSRHQPFETQVYYQPQESWVFSGDCTCPAGNDCYHCAALCLAWLNVRPQPVATGYEIDSWLEALQALEAPPTVKLPTIENVSLLEQWIYLLSPLPGQPQQQTPGVQGLQVEMGLQRRTTPARAWQKWQPFAPAQALNQFASAGSEQPEQELWGLLGSLPPVPNLITGHKQQPFAGSALWLTGKQGALALQELLATGRCFWRKAPQRDQQGALHSAAARRLQAQWRNVPGGQQLQARLEPEAPPLVGQQQLPLFKVGQQLFYYAADQQALGPVSTSLEQAQLWLNSPVVPPAALERVSRRLLAFLPAPALPTGLKWQELEINDQPPQPLLLLTREQPLATAGSDNPFAAIRARLAHLPNASARQPEMHKGSAQQPAAPQHCAQLFFEYGSQRLAFDLPPPTESNQLDENSSTLYRIRRDPVAEQQAYQLLLSTGLLPLMPSQGKTGHCFGLGQSGPDNLTVPQAAELLDTTAIRIPELRSEYALSLQVRNWHHWLSESLPQLQQAGWRVEFAPDFKLDFVSSPAWQAELSADLQRNSFDLALGVEINGEKVNLLPLLLRLLRSAPDLQALREELNRHSSWLLPLDPDPLASWAARSQHQQLRARWLEVPARRLARMLEILIELYDFVPTEQGTAPTSLELNYYSALQICTQALPSRLHPEDYGVSWQAPTGLEQVAGQLAGLQTGLTQDGPPVEPPVSLQAQLRPYQQRGLNWLSALRALGLNGILADDMGLGKTLQTLALLLSEKAAGRLQAPVLVVVPTSVLSIWEQETQRFAPSLHLLRYHGPHRDSLNLTGAELILTTYTLYRQDQALHQQTCYSWLILDEAQQIKNPRSRTALALCRQPAHQRLCLTGTPLENNLEELWSLFHFLMPGFLDSLERFNSRFRHPIEKTADKHALQALRERIRPFVLRRLKTQVATELPPKTEMVRSIALGNAQRDLYETVRLAVDKQVGQAIAESGFQRSRLLVLDALLKLRQVCCHPQLLKLPAAQQLQRSAKLDYLLQLLQELVGNGRRVLVFSQFVKMLELIEARLQAAALSYSKLTGQTRKREAAISRFQGGEVPIFLISLKAGGLGLNLTAADTVIHYDPWWNPAAEQQASDRSWRIGQTQPVFVYKLIASGTLEEQILALQANKQALSDGLLNPGRLDFEPQQLLALLKTQAVEND